MMEVVTGPVSIAQFRGLFPEFQDSSVYLDESIAPWLNIASSLLNPGRWGTMLSMGISLFVAHQIALGQAAAQTARRGGVPGQGNGIVSQKSVKDVSVSYDTNSAIMEKAGDWNLTVYGVRFLGFARMFGSGGVQIIGADATNFALRNALGAVGGVGIPLA